MALGDEPLSHISKPVGNVEILFYHLTGSCILVNGARHLPKDSRAEFA
jgi:hypothetical protein